MLIVGSGYVMFLLGVLVSYLLIFPLTFRFLGTYQVSAASTKMMIDDGEYSMSRFAGMYGFTYEGMATNKSEAKTLAAKLK